MKIFKHQRPVVCIYRQVWKYIFSSTKDVGIVLRVTAAGEGLSVLKEMLTVLVT